MSNGTLWIRGREDCGCRPEDELRKGSTPIGSVWICEHGNGWVLRRLTSQMEEAWMPMGKWGTRWYRRKLNKNR